MSSTNLGFYHFWSVLNYQTGHPVDITYIRYPREYANLPNAYRPFSYNYILSDNADLVRSLIKPADIAEIYKSDDLTLVRLKRPSRQIYLF